MRDIRLGIQRRRGRSIRTILDVTFALPGGDFVRRFVDFDGRSALFSVSRICQVYRWLAFHAELLKCTYRSLSQCFRDQCPYHHDMQHQMRDRSTQILRPSRNKSIPSRSLIPSKDPSQSPQDRPHMVDRQTCREVVVDRRSKSVREGLRGTIDPSVDGERCQARRQERERVVADDSPDLCLGKSMRCRALCELR